MEDSLIRENSGEITEESVIPQEEETKEDIYDIKQLRVSPCMKSFEKAFFKKFDLKPYRSRFIPAIFFGCYTNDDLTVIKKHSGFKVLIWAGSDTDYRRRKIARDILNKINKVPKLHHIAISDYITYDLKQFKLRSQMIPLCFSDFNQFPPAKKGKFIYFYTSISNPVLYGGDVMRVLYEKLKKKYKFIIAVNNVQMMRHKKNPKAYANNVRKYPYLKYAQTIKPEQVSLLYQKCFIGLRLTLHDGNANTTQEMGLCGIKCCFNGNAKLPNAIRWKNVNDLVRIINNEAKNIGTYDHVMCEKMRKYLSHDKRWLSTENYQ